MVRTTKTLTGLAVATLICAAAGAALAQPRGPGGPGGPGGQEMRGDDARPGEHPRALRFVRIFDTDGDGKVSMAEIAAEQKRVLGAADVDGNGALSVEEFRRRGRLIQSLGTTTLFDLLDTNGDRNITADELAAPAARWFARYDADGDGAMTAEELPTGRWGRHGMRGHRR